MFKGQFFKFGWAFLVANKRYHGPVSGNVTRVYGGDPLKIDEDTLKKYRNWFWEKLNEEEKQKYDRKQFHMFATRGNINKRAGTTTFHRNHTCHDMAYGGLRMIRYLNAQDALKMAKFASPTKQNVTIDRRKGFAKWKDGESFHCANFDPQIYSGDRKFVTATFLPRKRPNSKQVEAGLEILKQILFQKAGHEARFVHNANKSVWNQLEAKKGINPEFNIGTRGVTAAARREINLARTIKSMSQGGGR